MQFKKIQSVVAAAALLCSLGANAVSVTVTAESQGWVSSVGDGNGTGPNTFTGNEFSKRFNSWVSFDLSSVSASIDSAVFHVTPSNYPGNDPTAYSVSLYDVTYVSYGQLQSSTAGVLGYLDLGAGGLYGTASFTPGAAVSITLSAQAIADINANLGGRFLIGFTNNTLNSVVSTSSMDLGVYTGGGSLELISSVPEPESYAMFLAGLGAVGFVAMRRKSA